MVCRETKVGSAMTSIVKIGEGLQEHQSLSLYHEIMAEAPTNGAPPHPDQRAAFAREQISKVEASNAFTPARKRSIIERLRASEDHTVASEVFYASQRIEERSRLARVALDDYYDNTARSLGCTVAEVRQRLSASYIESDRERTLAAPDDWKQEFRSRPGQAHLPMDRHTAYAMWRMDTQIAAMEQAAPTEPVVTGHVAIEDPVINAVGYDPESRRLEVETRSRRGVMNAYRNVSPELHDQMMASDNPGAFYRRHIQGNATHAYDSVEHAESAGIRHRCSTCGQFAGEGHNCPSFGSDREMANTIQRARTQQAVLRARQAVESGTRAERIARYEAQGHSEQDAERIVEGEDRTAQSSPDTAMTHERAQHLVWHRHPYRGDSGTFRVTALSTVRFILDEEPRADVPVWARITRVEGITGQAEPCTAGVVTGRVVATRLSGHTSDRNGVYEVGEHESQEQRLKCTCLQYRTNYRCVHIDQVMRDMNQRINSDDLRTRHTIGEAQQVVEAEARVEHEVAVASQAAAIQEWQPGGNPMTYSEDPTVFQADYDAAKADIAAGRNPMTYMTENATDGLGAREGGRAFGVEIEFDLPDSMPHMERGEALAAIGRDLHAAGLTTTSYQEPYHSGANNGHQAWSFEEDCTVAGEIVSPKMYDEPQTWTDLARVCEIVKRHGGRASVRAGSHVHVSTGDYDHDVANYSRMLDMYHENEDVFTRLASNPERGTHRCQGGAGWARGNQHSGRGYTSSQQAAWSNSGSYAINMQDMSSGERGDHVEVRMWDSTLEPEAIQAQIKMSLALTAAAHRETGYQPESRQPRGTSRADSRARRDGARRMTGEDWRESTKRYRKMVDTLFRRPEDKKQMTGLFARTKWQR